MRFDRPGYRLATLWLAFCASWLPAIGHAQIFDLDQGRETLVSLDGKWRFHPGDSPFVPGSDPKSERAELFAEPGFDDSSWKLLKSNQPFSTQGYPGMSGFAWYRFEVRTPGADKPISLLLAPILTSFEVFADGKLVGACGAMPPTIIPSTQFGYHIYPLTTPGSGQARTIHVALRVWHSPIWAGYVGGGPAAGGSLAGDTALLTLEMEHHRLARNTRYVDAYAYSMIASMVGFAILWLFLIRPGEREYLWFAAMLLAQATDHALYVCQRIFFWPAVPIYDLTDGLLVAVNVCAALCFFSLVLRTRVGNAGRAALALAIVSPAAAVLYWPGWFSAPASASIQIVCLLPAVVWVLWVLVDRSFKGNKDALLLLIPAGLDLGYYLVDNIAIVLGQAGLAPWPKVFEQPLPLPPFSLDPGIALHLIFLLALLVFLILRFSRARRREVWMAGEFEAARQIQQILLPAELEHCPGFHVECIYQPAEQVGGDFFQQIADDKCGMLIVVGDVSGKGLPAAMMVSVLVGAIRAEAGHRASPAEMLESLNERMMGRLQGGFATCLAAHIDVEGVLRIANAGHLPPYLNGEEMTVAGSLPLGVAAGLLYETREMRLKPGDRLMFISDGVVEAQSRTGELFGFERTRAISTEPAAKVAQAAREFGQIDDITVVTVEFTGVHEPAEVEPAT